MTAGVDEALAALKERLPGFRVYSMGEYPARREQGAFFCGIERRPRGGRVYLGEAQTLARAIDRAVALGAEDRA